MIDSFKAALVAFVWGIIGLFIMSGIWYPTEYVGYFIQYNVGLICSVVYIVVSLIIFLIILYSDNPSKPVERRKYRK